MDSRTNQSIACELGGPTSDELPGIRRVLTLYTTGTGGEYALRGAYQQ